MYQRFLRRHGATHTCSHARATQYSIPNATTDLNGETFEGIGVGGLFSYGFGVEDDRWTVLESGSDSVFNLGLSGDTILVYCLKTDGTPHFLSGFSYAPSGWVDAGLADEEYGAQDSALPDDLAVNGSVAVPYFQNNLYNGASSSITTKGELLKSYMEPANYEGSNDMLYQLPILTSGAASGWMMVPLAVMTLATWLSR